MLSESERFHAIAEQISLAFCEREYRNIDGGTDRSAERLDKFAERLKAFTVEYIDAQRTGFHQFTVTDIASRYLPRQNT